MARYDFDVPPGYRNAIDLRDLVKKHGAKRAEWKQLPGVGNEPGPFRVTLYDCAVYLAPHMAGANDNNYARMRTRALAIAEGCFLYTEGYVVDRVASRLLGENSSHFSTTAN